MLDEATAALDAESEKLVQDALDVAMVRGGAAAVLLCSLSGFDAASLAGCEDCDTAPLDASSALHCQHQRQLTCVAPRHPRSPPSQAGRTTFVVAHRLSTIVNCDKIAGAWAVPPCLCVCARRWACLRRRLTSRRCRRCARLRSLPPLLLCPRPPPGSHLPRPRAGERHAPGAAGPGSLLRLPGGGILHVTTAGPQDHPPRLLSVASLRGAQHQHQH